MRSRKMLAAAAALSVAAAAALLARPAQTPEQDGSVQTAGLPAAQEQEAQPSAQTACWTVGLWQGHVAVFHQGAAGRAGAGHPGKYAGGAGGPAGGLRLLTG